MSPVVVKLGSSVVADDDGTVRREVLHRICDDIALLHAAGHEPIIVTSGAIARGFGVMEIPPTQRPRGIDALQAASAIGQGRLYRAYEDLLRERGVRSAQVLLTFLDMSARTHYLNVRQTLAKLLEWRVVPVVNENDTTTTDEISFGDNDFLAAQVAVLVGAERLVLLTNTDGVFTADPRTDASAELLRTVADVSELRALAITEQTSSLGTGGMRSKVAAAEMATAAGIATVIANGQVAGIVAAAAHGEQVGTTFLPREDPEPSFKLWLKYAKPARGRVRIDSGAARALREAGTSLLPVGVVDVDGSFDVGDAIEITFGDERVGKGISNYSSEELKRVRGMKSAAVRELLPLASDEAVHRDYFVLG